MSPAVAKKAISRANTPATIIPAEGCKSQNPRTIRDIPQSPRRLKAFRIPVDSTAGPTSGQ